MTFVPGQTLTAAELNVLIPPNAGLIGGTGTTFSIVNTGSGLALSGGTLNANWQLGTVAALLGLAIVSGSLEAQWQGGAITALGSGVSGSGGTLTATGSGGSVTSVVAGTGLNGGTISTTGTLTANYQGGTLTSFGTGLTLTGGALTPNYQAGTLTAFKSGLTIAAGTLAADWEGGVVSSLATGLSIVGGALTPAFAVAGNGIALNSGTVAIDNSQTLNGTVAGTLTIAPASGVSNVVVNVPTASGTVTIAAAPAFVFQKTVMHIKQGSTPQSVSLNSGFVFAPSGGPTSYTATPTASVRDMLGLYSVDGTHWVVDSILQGLSI